MKKYFLSILLADILLGESLSVIVVDTKKEVDSTEISATKINRVKIDNSIQRNGYISSLLDTNANIEVEDTSQNSLTAGEIKPGKISINKAPFYQNSFLVDSISNDSLIDPNISRVNDPYDVPGNENEFFLDLDLIDYIKVYDSNISAQYGNFTGGVIDAKTIRVKDKTSYKFSFGHTSDKLTKFHVHNSENFEQAKTDNSQPKFDKRFYNLYFSKPINDSNSMIFSYSRKESIIPGAYFGGFRDKKRLNQSFFLKGSHFFDDDSVLDIVGIYSPYESTHFQEYIKDSDAKIKGGGYNIKAKYEKDFDFWSMDTNFALRRSENSRDSLNYNKEWIKTKSKPWGPINESGGKEYSKEGGSGNIEKTQSAISYNLGLNSQEYKTGLFNHKFKTGFDFDFKRANYNRKDNTYYYNEATLNTNINCVLNTNDCVEGEQYFKERRIYQKENVNADIFSSDFYLEDKITYKNFELSPGLRVDYNNYLKNLDLSYRLNGSIKLFKNNKTVIYGGLNRYYGKSFLGYKLREARLPHYDQYRSSYKNIPNEWGTSADKDNQKYIFSNLKTPYTDERVIGLRQDIDIVKLRTNLKYVHRNAKNKFSQHLGDYKVFTMPDGVLKGYYRPKYFGNAGYSISEIVSLNIGPTKALDFGIFNLGYSFSTSWSHSSSNSSSYEDIIEDKVKDTIDKAYYKGKFYDRENLPEPKKPNYYNLHLNMAFKSFDLFGLPTRLNLNNVIRYTSSYTDIVVPDSSKTVVYKDILPDKSTKEYDVLVYEDVDFKKAITLDMSASFNFKIKDKHNLNFVTEVTNVFDKVQNVGTSLTKYKTGRQFWFNIAYRF